MNILVTLDKGYIHPLSVMLKSLIISNKNTDFDVYVMNTELEKQDFEYIKSFVPYKRLNIIDLKVNNCLPDTAPVTDRYPVEMYYRIFAAKFLPETVEKILYLDPDLVVLKSLRPLYNTNMEENYFAAASHVGRVLTKVNNLRLSTEDGDPYINSGVMLMNIKLLREQQDFTKVFDYIEKNKNLLILPDQDVISAVYGDRIMEIDPFVYNMTERLLIHPDAIEKKIDMAWVAQNTAVIHFCGRNKPWKEYYMGLLGFIWHYMASIEI